MKYLDYYDDLLTPKQIAVILGLSISIIYKWRTVFNYCEPRHFKLGGKKGKVLYPKEGLLKFIKSCALEGTTLPENLEDLFPLLTVEQFAEQLGLKVNSIWNNPNIADCGYFRIHPLCDANLKGQGCIRFSTWHLNQLLKIESN